MYSLIIVDDDDNIRSGLVHLFPWHETGFQVVADHSSASAAWSFIEQQGGVTAVLCDIRMPVMDGLELTGRLYEAYPDTHVVLMSGYQDFSYAQQALRYGVSDFLVKPMKHSALMLAFHKIRDALDKAGGEEGTNELPNQYYAQILRTVKTYVAENLRTATLEEAAVNVNLSSSYLSRLFKTETGLSFTEYLIQKRMEYACVLLSAPSNKIYEISDAIGYDSPNNFSRAFKNFYDISPKEFRKKGGLLP